MASLCILCTVVVLKQERPGLKQGGGVRIYKEVGGYLLSRM